MSVKKKVETASDRLQAATQNTSLGSYAGTLSLKPPLAKYDPDDLLASILVLLGKLRLKYGFYRQRFSR
jgi:hypothetical protein